MSAKVIILNNVKINLALAPPTVTTPIYLCQNSITTPLTATPSVVGAILTWYTTSTGGIGTLLAPIPSTTTLGSTTYYVTETIGGVESNPRTPLVVNVVADNGAVINGPLKCDPSQIPIYSLNYSPPATINNSVLFDWSNNPLISNTYNVSYSIQGGPIMTATTGTSHWLVPNMSPGQSAILTLTSATHPCVPSQTVTCTVPCGATTTTPTFNSIPPICSGDVLALLPTTSNNGVTGTWSPALDNTTTRTYTFTPSVGQCDSLAILTITVNPKLTPLFAVRSAICNGDPITPLPTTSTNGVSGAWSPATDNTTSTTYTFTPNVGQCASQTTLTISVNPIVTPNFAPIPTICSGDVAPALTTTSPNGITGTWSPTTVSNTVGRSYIFTPTSGQCSNNQTLNVTITPRTTTNFASIPSFCAGSAALVLSNTSPNGVTGTWSPAVIDNTASGSYVFTPNASECATTYTLNVVVTPLVVPDFVDISICSGSVPPALATTSPNGVSGTWSPSTINNTTSGPYVFTPNAPQCATSKTINVTVYPSNTLVSISWTVTNAFSNNQIVTVTAYNSGSYLYQLDSGSFQSSTSFENVASGLHSITVKEPNGCSAPIIENNILVINYPKYFTPNGDSFNDRWNIFDLRDQLNSRIYIFDRFGKLLKDISPLESGWDGTYIGQPLPADDYWFTVEYVEQSVIKIFKGHFALKR
jgi:gliding motility-associated-like protein